MGPFNFTSGNIFGPSIIYIDYCAGTQPGVIMTGSGGPSRLSGPIISTNNNTGAFLTKGYLVYTYRNSEVAARRCGPAGVSLQLEFRCDQTTSQRESLGSSERSWCNILFTVYTVHACPAVPPVQPEATTPFVDVVREKSICRAYDRGIDLSSIYGFVSFHSEYWARSDTLLLYRFPVDLLLSSLSSTLLLVPSTRAEIPAPALCLMLPRPATALSPSPSLAI